MSKSLDEIKNIIIPILKHHGAKKAGLFGSIVSGNVTPQSDIDVLVELDSDLSLLDIVGIRLELEDALGQKVDLVEYDTIKPIIRDRILQQQLSIL